MKKSEGAMAQVCMDAVQIEMFRKEKEKESMKWKKIISGVLAFAMVMTSVISGSPMEALAEVGEGDGTMLTVPTLAIAAPADGETAAMLELSNEELGLEISAKSPETVLSEGEDNFIKLTEKRVAFTGPYRAQSSTDDFDVYNATGANSSGTVTWFEGKENRTTPVIISFDLYLSGNPKESTIPMVGKLNGNNNQYVLSLHQESNTDQGFLEMWARAHGREWSGAKFLYDKDAFKYKTWNTIVMVYDSYKRYCMYINGKPCGKSNETNDNGAIKNGDCLLVHYDAPFVLGSPMLKDEGGFISNFKFYSGNDENGLKPYADRVSVRGGENKDTWDTDGTAYKQNIEPLLKSVRPTVSISSQGVYDVDSKWSSTDSDGVVEEVADGGKFECGKTYKMDATVKAPEGYCYPTEAAAKADFEKKVSDQMDVGTEAGAEKTVSVIDAATMKVSVKYPTTYCATKEIQTEKIPLKRLDMALGEKVGLNPKVITEGMLSEEGHGGKDLYAPVTYEVTEGENAVSVDKNGTVTALAAGTASVRVKSGNVSKDISISVSGEYTELMPSVTFMEPVADTTPKEAVLSREEDLAVHSDEFRVSGPAGTSLSLKNSASLQPFADEETDGIGGFNGEIWSESGTDAFNVTGTDHLIISYKLFLKKLPGTQNGREYVALAKQNQYCLSIQHRNGQPTLRFYANDDNGSGWPEVNKTFDESFLNQWHDIMFVVENGRMNAFIDGVKVRASNQSLTLAGNNNKSFLNRRFTICAKHEDRDLGNYLLDAETGYVADVKFYSGKDAAMTDEIKTAINLDTLLNNGEAAKEIEKTLEKMEPTVRVSLNEKSYQAKTVWTEIGSSEPVSKFEQSVLDGKGYMAQTVLRAPVGCLFTEDDAAAAEKIATGTEGSENPAEVKVSISSDRKTMTISAYYGNVPTITADDIDPVTYTAPADNAAPVNPEIPAIDNCKAETVWTVNGEPLEPGEKFTNVAVNSYVAVTEYTAENGYLFVDSEEFVNAIKSKMEAANAAENAVVDVAVSNGGTTLTVSVAYQINVALNRPASSSGNETASLTPEKAVDGEKSDSSRWVGAKMKETTPEAEDPQPSYENGSDQWLMLDMKAQETTFSEIAITYHAKAWGTEYRIETSDDPDAADEDWETVIEVNKEHANVADQTHVLGNDASDNTVTCNTNKLKRYVRFYYTKINRFALAAISVSIQEVEIKGVRKNLYYTVSFDTGNGGSRVNPQDVFTGGRAVKPANPSAAGKSFAYWYKDDEVTAYDFDTPVKEDMTLTAKWNPRYSYTIYMNQPGLSNSGGSLIAGDKIPKPADPSVNGAEFVGWYTDDTYANEFDFDSAVSANATIFARWRATVTYDPNGGSGQSQTKTVFTDQVVGEPETAFNKEGHTLKGWTTDAIGTEAFDVTTGKINRNTTLYAKWEPQKQTVTLHTNGHGTLEANKFEVSYGQAIKNLPTLTEDGWMHVGWYTSEACNDSDRYTNAPVTGPLDLWAKWVDPSTTTVYTVKFNMHGGAAIQDVKVEAGEKLGAVADPVRTGYIFGGWYLDAEYTQEFSFDSPISANITLHAKWTPESSDMVPVTGIALDVHAFRLNAIGDTKELTAAITPDNATNQEVLWTTDNPEVATVENGVVTAVGEGTTVITVIAQDNAEIKDQATVTVNTSGKCVVKFVVNGGTAIGDISVDIGTAVARPKDPTRAGYQFAGWFTDAACTKAYDFKTELQEDITLYAKWQPDGQKPPTGGNPPAGGSNPPAAELKPGETKDLADSIRYEIVDAKAKTVLINRGLSVNKKKVKIPTTVTINNQKYTVVGIKANAFKNYKKITSIVIPANVKSIGNKAFMGCKKLKTVTIKGASITIGKQAFKGTSSKLKIKIKKMKAKKRQTFQKQLRKKSGNKKLKVTK